MAVALYRGQCLVTEFMSYELLAAAGFDPTGMPVREAFPEPAYRDLLAVIERVMRTREPETVDRASGRVTVLPVDLEEPGDGVAVHVQLVSVVSRPRLRLPAALLGLLVILPAMPTTL